MDIARLNLFRIACLVCSVILVMGVPALADDKVGEAKQILERITVKILDDINSRRDEIRTRPEVIKAIISANIEPYINITIISKRVLGKEVWDNASREQKKEFALAFKKRVLSYCSTGLHEFLRATDEKLDPKMVVFDEPTKVGTTRIAVKSVFKLNASRQYPMIFRMTHETGKWKIYDVVVSGKDSGYISLVSLYRESLKSGIDTHGLDGMIESLKQRNQEILSNVNRRQE